MISMLRKLPRFAIAVLFCAGLVFGGCATSGQSAGAKADGKTELSGDRIPLRAGDTVKVTLVTPTLPNQANSPQEYKVTIKEDGTIALPYFPGISAAGKTARELEQLIREKYVPDYYKTLGVTVEPDTRFFYVGGEVNKPDRHEYIGGITVTRAIEASQGFTDYADRKNIKLIRSNGKVEKVNWKQAINHPDKDPQVYPGDTVQVLRRWF